MARAKDVLEIIHSDVCGPFREIVRGGFYYFVTFIYRLSIKVWAFVSYEEQKGIL